MPRQFHSHAAVEAREEVKKECIVMIGLKGGGGGGGDKKKYFFLDRRTFRSQLLLNLRLLDTVTVLPSRSTIILP